jgi:hypothetical protein
LGDLIFGRLLVAKLGTATWPRKLESGREGDFGELETSETSSKTPGDELFLAWPRRNALRLNQYLFLANGSVSR